MEKSLARKKLKHFAEKFVMEYEMQLKELEEIISGVPGTREACAEAAGEAAGLLARAAAPLVGLPMLGSVPMLGTVVTAVVSYLGKWYKKNRAKKLKRLTIAFRENESDTRKLLVKSAVEIFYMFEYQLCRVERDDSWKSALNEFAEDAVGRSIAFFQSSRDRFELKGVVKGVIMGHSQCKSTFPAFKSASGRYVTFTDKITDDWETSEVYSEAGLLLQIENDKFRVHCKKKVSQDLASPADLFRYGYRLSSTIPALRCWENSQYFEDRKINLRDRPQEYLLMSSDPSRDFRPINPSYRSQEYLLMLSDLSGLIKEVSKVVSSKRSKINDPSKFTAIALKDDIFSFQLKPPVKDFVERSGKLEEITKCFTEYNILVLSGLAGHGKSELALKYAEQCKEDIVIFLSAQTRHSLEESFITLVESCFINLKLKENGQPRNIAWIVRDVYAALKNKKCLFIFDDAPGYEEIEKLLPEYEYIEKEKDWTVLITSNKTEWKDPDNRISFGNLKVTEFTHKEAVAFVEKILGNLTENDVKNLVDKLHNHPMGIRLAAANIKQRVEQCQKRNQLYTVNQCLEEFVNDCERKILEDPRISIPLRLTFSCIEQDENGRKARRLLNIMSYLDVSGIPDTLFLKFLANDNRHLHDIISILEKYSLVSVEKQADGQFGMLAVNGLVPDFLKSLMANDTEKKFTEEETINDALEILKTYMQEGLLHCKTCVPHLISVWNDACNYKKIVEKFITALTSSASFFYHIVNFGNSDMIKKTLDHLDTSSRAQLFKFHKDHHVLISAALSNRSDNLDIVKLLISYGADEKNVINERGSNLLEAAGRGNLGIVKYLVEEKKFDPNKVKNKHGVTALHVASEQGQLHVVKYLVEEIEIVKRRADPKVADNEGNTPVHKAAACGHLGIVKYLAEEIKMAKKRVDLRVTNNYGDTLVHLASAKGHLDIVKYLIEEMRVDMRYAAKNIRGDTALHFAAEHGQLEIVKYFVEARRIDDNSTGCEPGGTPLHFAAAQGIAKLDERLTDLNVTNNNGWTPLHIAASHGFHDVVAYLIEERKCDPNFPNPKSRRTALSVAIKAGHLKVADYLVNHGASIIHKCDHKHTLLHEAVISISPDALDFVLKLLKERCADNFNNLVNAADKEGDTPLMWAIEMGSTKNAKTLLDNGADVNVVNEDNETALHWAAKTGDWKTANILLENEIKDDLKNKDKKTALEVAKDNAKAAESEEEKSKFLRVVEILE